MITSAVVSAWLWVHIGVLLIVVGYATCGHAIAPIATERGRVKLAIRPVRTALVGVLISGPWVVASIVLMNLPNGALKFAGVALLVVWLMVCFIGLGSVALHVGDRGTSGGARWTDVSRGAAFLALTWMLPVVGWFVALPLSLACGLGCMLGSRRVLVAAD